MDKTNFSNFNAGDTVTVQLKDNSLLHGDLIELTDDFIGLYIKIDKQEGGIKIPYTDLITMFKLVEVEKLENINSEATKLISEQEQAMKEWCEKSPLT